MRNMSTSTSANLLSQLSSNISVESVNPDTLSSANVQLPPNVSVNVDAPKDGGFKVPPSISVTKDGGVKVLPSISVTKDGGLKVLPSISVKSVSSDGPSPANVQLPAGISITSISPDQIKKSSDSADQSKKPGVPPSTDADLWNQFEEFRKWQDSLSSSSSAPSSSPASSLPASSINAFLNRPGNASISRIPPAAPKSVNTPINRASTNTPINRASTNTLINRAPTNRRMSLPYRRTNSTTQSNLLSNQTLNQPLNPATFMPGAFKCFSKSRQQIALTKNARNYPQLNSEALKRQASTFMAAPTPQILAQMRQEGFAKDFQVENCRSSSEYLYCLMGYGLHQALNFPVMGVFYLELVRLIMKHIDKFSDNEKVKLIQVSNVCEDILRQNSTRDDFLPVDSMDKIIEEAIKEEGNIKKMIDEFNNDQQLSGTQTKSKAEISYLASQVSTDINKKLNMFSNISVSLASEPKAEEVSTETSEAEDTSVVIDLDEVDDSVINIDSNVSSALPNLRSNAPDNRILNAPNRRFSNVQMNRTKYQAPKRPVGPHFVKPLNISDDLATLLGLESGAKVSRQEIVKKLWIYVKEKKLQDPENGQWLTPDEAMEPIFGKEKIKGFGMVKYLRGHLTD